MLVQVQIVLALLLALLTTSASAEFDCYQFSKSQFATIVSCPYACEYSYKTTSSSKAKTNGGCASQNFVGCRTRGDLTTCTCSGDRCNEKGYSMDSSDEDD